MKTRYKVLRLTNALTCDQSHDPKVVQKWLKEMKDNFELMEVPIEVCARVVIPFLVNEATIWWEGVLLALLEEGPITWSRFREVFLNNFFQNALYLKKMVEFNNLVTTSNMLVVEHLAKFHTLGKYLLMVMADAL